MYTLCHLDDFKYLADMLEHIRLPLKVDDFRFLLAMSKLKQPLDFKEFFYNCAILNWIKKALMKVIFHLQLNTNPIICVENDTQGSIQFLWGIGSNL